MNIYIAGAFAAQERLRAIRDSVEALGHHVTSTWLDESDTDSASPQWDEYALRDLMDIGYATLLILDTADPDARGGREWEGGYAQGQGLPVWLVGPRRSVFHTLVTRQFKTWDAVLKGLAH